MFEEQRKNIGLILSAVLIIALLTSKFLLSLSMIGLFLLALLDVSIKPKFYIRLNPHLSNNFTQFINHKGYLALTSIFFIILITGFYTNDWVEFAHRLRIKLPFLILPFAFCSLPRFTKKETYSLLYLLMNLIFISSFFVIHAYTNNSTNIIEALGIGQPFPTPINHIRYSLLVAMSIITGLLFISEKFYLKYHWERYLIAILTIFLFGFIHFLSVRSGLLSLYGAIFLLFIKYIYTSRKYIVGIVGVLFLVSLPVIAYFTMPSFKEKVEYTLHDRKMYKQGEVVNYSDGQRIASWQVGFHLIQQHPIVGVGFGDLKTELRAAYELLYPEMPGEPRMPHNQFILMTTGGGFLSLILFIIAFFTPLFYKRYYNNSFFFAFYIIIFLSLIPENTIETAIGTAITIFPFLLLMHYINQSTTSTSKGKA